MEEADWAINEFGRADLGDTRRTDRLVRLASVLAQRPAASLPAACDDPAMLKGAYRLLENPAVEPAPPAGVEALDWLLWTSVPTPDQAAAERITWYTCREGVEVWHHVLKSGCALEARRLESMDALRRGLALYSVIAWCLLYAPLLARAAPDLPCTVLLAVAEWQAFYCAIHKTPTLRQAVRWLARLGGFLGRTSDGEPGVQVLWRGFQRLHDLTLMFEVFSPLPRRRKCG